MLKSTVTWYFPNLFNYRCLFGGPCINMPRAISVLQHTFWEILSQGILIHSVNLLLIVSLTDTMSNQSGRRGSQKTNAWFWPIKKKKENQVHVHKHTYLSLLLNWKLHWLYSFMITSQKDCWKVSHKLTIWITLTAF